MRFFRGLFNFYLEASIHVSISVCSLVYITFLERDLTPSANLLGFAFFGTITAYNFIKYASKAGFHHRSLTKNLRIIQIFSFFSFLIFLFFLFQLPKKVLLASLLMGVVTLLYIVPFLKNKNLRNFSGLKIFIVALVWAGVTVILPWLYEKSIIIDDLWLLFVQRFFLVLVLIFPFEIRDLVYDDYNLGTFPQIFGIKKTKLFGGFLIVVSILLEYFKDEINISHLISMCCIGILLWFILLFSTKQQSKYYASFWVEGVPIIWLGLFAFLSNYLIIS